jgi:hypothetical protein
MTTMRPDEVAALFDLPPLPAATTSTAEAAHALEAAEAELAAELAAALESGAAAADDAPDSRTDRRVEVAWPARMRWPDGRVVELEVRNISEGGMGLMSDEHIPSDIVVDFEMDVPALEEGGKITLVKGTIKTAYTVAHGSEILCGGTWQVPPAGLELVNRWIKGLPR